MLWYHTHIRRYMKPSSSTTSPWCFFKMVVLPTFELRYRRPYVAAYQFQILTVLCKFFLEISNSSIALNSSAVIERGWAVIIFRIVAKLHDSAEGEQVRVRWNWINSSSFHGSLSNLRDEHVGLTLCWNISCYLLSCAWCDAPRWFYIVNLPFMNRASDFTYYICAY